MLFMYSARHHLQIVMKLEFSKQFFEKYVNLKFREIPSIGIPVQSMPNITIQIGISTS